MGLSPDSIIFDCPPHTVEEIHRMHEELRYHAEHPWDRIDAASLEKESALEVSMTQSPMDAALNKLAKWRAVLTGWAVGTRSIEDPESNAMRDLQEVRLLMRAELSAITNLLIQKGVLTSDEFCDRIEFEARMLDKDMEERFPGFSTTQDGVTMTMPEALETVRRYNFPP